VGRIDPISGEKHGDKKGEAGDKAEEKKKANMRTGKNRIGRNLENPNWVPKKQKRDLMKDSKKPCWK